MAINPNRPVETDIVFSDPKAQEIYASILEEKRIVDSVKRGERDPSALRERRYYVDPQDELEMTCYWIQDVASSVIHSLGRCFLEVKLFRAWL